MVFKLVEAAQKTWRRIDGHNQLPKLIQGVKFADGIEVIGNSAAPYPQPPPDPSARHQDSAIARHDLPNGSAPMSGRCGSPAVDVPTMQPI